MAFEGNVAETEVLGTNDWWDLKVKSVLECLECLFIQIRHSNTLPTPIIIPANPHKNKTSLILKTPGVSIIQKNIIQNGNIF
jgi:hypothetical protein